MPVRFLLTALVCALTLSSAHALEFRLLSWTGDVTDLFYLQGGKPIPVTANETTISPLYKWQGSEKLVFFRETEQEGRPVRVPVLVLDAPSGTTKAIILLSLDRADPTRNSGQWIDDTVDGIPPDAVTYLNLSTQVIGVQLGQETSTINAKASKTFRLEGAKRRLLTLKVAAQNEGGWQIAASSALSTYPGRRTLIILRDGRPQANGLIDLVEMLRFDDYPEPVASAQ